VSLARVLRIFKVNFAAFSDPVFGIRMVSAFGAP
jgi:hypothetical protein